MKTLVTLGCILLFGASYAATNFFSKPAGRILGPAADEIDYVGQLPRPGDLVNAEAPDGAKVSKIVQTGGEVRVTYALAGGRGRVVSYRLLANAGSGGEVGSAWDAVAASAPAMPVVAPASLPVVASPVPVMVYNDNSPTNTIVNPPPAPVYSDAAATVPGYLQPAPAYYDSGPDYSAYQQPSPGYYYGPAYAYYYRSVPREFPREFQRPGGRESFPGGPRDGGHPEAGRTVGRR